MQKLWGIVLGMLQKVGIFLGRQILKLGFFFGIKYEPLSDPPPLPLSLKYVSEEWDPWEFSFVCDAG